MSMFRSPLLPGNGLDLPPSEVACLSPLQEVSLPIFESQGLRLSIKREDLLGTGLGGNKYYKLYGHIENARRLLNEGRLGSNMRFASYGGAWSNHLYALAHAAKILNVPALAIIRGEKNETPSAMIQDITKMGVQVEFISRSQFRQKNTPEGQAFREKLDTEYGKHYWIPEGGGGLHGARYCAAIVEGVLACSSFPVDVIAHACGTATTLAGMVASEAGKAVELLGVAVLKAGDTLNKEVTELLKVLMGDQGGSKRWGIDHQSHCGGYAKLPEDLLDFILDFETRTGIPLDPIYTGKMMYGLTRLAEMGKWPPGSHIVAVHSGGLQGRRGWSCFQGENRRNLI